MTNAIVKTRIAPSPTGDDLHIGNLYTALFNWAYAKNQGGNFIVRIEDTDQKRKIEGSEDRILQTLKRFGLQHDEGVQVGGEHEPYRQSERLDIYIDHAKQLVEQGDAYYCFCTSDRLKKVRDEMMAAKKPPMYDRHCRSLSNDDVKTKLDAGEDFVIRLKVPDDETITFNDLVRGDISIESNVVDDQVLIKSDGFPTYHMAVVVDDHIMGVTHVIRGEEWISSVPKHVLLYRAFKWDLPVYCHISLLRNADKSKLSKRKNPVWASWYLEEGFLPEAVLNFLALLGWSHPDEKEIFSLEEFTKVIDLKRFKTVGPIFDIQKLEWMNGEYIRDMSEDDLVKKLVAFYADKDVSYSEDLIKKTVPLIQTRMKTLKEYDDYCRFFIESPTEYEKDISGNEALFKKIYESLYGISDDNWKADIIGQTLQDVATEEGVGFGKFFMLIRIALTGKKVTPPTNESMEILGKEECLKRLSR